MYILSLARLAIDIACRVSVEETTTMANLEIDEEVLVFHRFDN